jgi:RNA polymerase sigma-70 factor (ECF subfamily)
VPLDTGERGVGERLADEMTPERIFAHKWALLLLDRALKAVSEKYVHAGQADQFETLKGFLTGSGQQPHYARAALDLGLSESAVKMAVHRMRRRWGDALRTEVGRTVADPGEVDEEIRYLFSVLSR